MNQVHRLLVRSGLVLGMSACLCSSPALGAPETKAAPPKQVAAKAAELDPMMLKDPTNAALVYWQSWENLRPLMQIVTEKYTPSPDWHPDAELTAKLVEHQGNIRVLIEATEIRDADFGVQWSKGIGALLPQLGRLRASAQVLAADAQRLADAGDSTAAAQRLAACFRISRHLSQDPTLISVLVAMAVSNMTASRVDVLINSGNITHEGKATLLKAIDAFPAEDPFRARDALMGERRWGAEWMASIAKGPDAGRRAKSALEPLAQEGPEYARVLSKLEVMNEEGVSQELDKLRRLFELAQQSFLSPNAANEMRALDERGTAGEFGLLHCVLGPALATSAGSAHKGMRTLENIRERLDLQRPTR